MNFPTSPSGPSHHIEIVDGSDKLVVFFSGTGMRDGNFHYWKIGKSIRAHRLFVNNGRNHWYQDGIPGLGDTVDDTVTAIDQWASKLGAREIYTVGQSMGGHGAILYGAKIGARVLAFGAETVLNLEASRSSLLIQDDPTVAYPHLSEVVSTARNPLYLFAGERDPIDIYNLSFMQGFRECHVRSMVRMGHGMVSYLHNRNRFVPLLQRLLENRPPPRMNAYGSALNHPGFETAFYDLHRHSVAKRWDAAVDAGERAISIYPKADHAFYLLAGALFSLKEFGLAKSHMENALELAPTWPEYRFLMAKCLARMGEKQRAIDINRDIIGLVPSMAAAHFELSLLHFSLGNYEESLEAASRATDLRPTVVRYLQMRERADQKLHRVSQFRDGVALKGAKTAKWVVKRVKATKKMLRKVLIGKPWSR
jgi:tetratricopeptide (TPR) repeat protein